MGCWKKKNLIEEKAKLDVQAHCSHSQTHEEHRSTSSGCTIIHEIVCSKCNKVLEHSSESVPAELQMYHRH